LRLNEGDANCSEFLVDNAPSPANTINVFYDPHGGRMVIAMRIAPGRNRIYLIYHKDVLQKRPSGRHQSMRWWASFRQPVRRVDKVERVAGIEPARSAWEADKLPLHHTRAWLR
jgi:hypothetical protein